MRPGSGGRGLRSAVPGSWGPFQRARVVDQLSQETRDLVGGPAVSNSLPGRLRPVPEGLQCPPTVPGDSDRDRGLGVDEMSLATRTHAEGTWGRPRLPGDLGPCPRPRGLTRYP